MQENQPGRASVPSNGSGMRLRDLRGQKSEVWHVNDQPLGSGHRKADRDLSFDFKNVNVGLI